MDATGVWKIVDLDGGLGSDFTKRMDFTEAIEKYKKKYPDRFIIFAQIWFSPGAGHDRILSGKVVDDLDKAVKIGAQGLKIWKNLGMRSRDSLGNLIAVNDPRLDPLWSKAGELGIPVLIHVVDPDTAFQPLDRFNEAFEFLQGAESWNFFGLDPSLKRTVLLQFEDVLNKHPNTIFIGAHLLMDAEHLDYVSELLDKYPNLYVDMGFAVHHLGRQPYTARKFFIKYQDRILFGTDANPTEEDYRAHFRFLETDDEYFDPPFAYMHLNRWKIYGLKLPDEVLEKVYNKNAYKILYKKSMKGDIN
jgi:predicted TIM-barrel fold metal-dependent hydrolase